MILRLLSVAAVDQNVPSDLAVLVDHRTMILLLLLLISFLPWLKMSSPLSLSELDNILSNHNDNNDNNDSILKFSFFTKVDSCIVVDSRKKQDL